MAWPKWSIWILLLAFAEPRFRTCKIPQEIHLSIPAALLFICCPHLWISSWIGVFVDHWYTIGSPLMFSHTCSSAHSLPSCIVRKCSFQASLSVSGLRTSISLYLGGPEFISQAIYPFPLPTLARQFTSLCCFPTPLLSLLIFLLSLCIAWYVILCELPDFC